MDLLAWIRYRKSIGAASGGSYHGGISAFNLLRLRCGRTTPVDGTDSNASERTTQAAEGGEQA